MPLESSLLGLLVEELKKLSADEVANFCGEVFVQQSKTRFLQGTVPILWQISPSSNHENVQVISFESTEHQLIEVALLRSQWEIFSNADRLTYRFFRKEFSAAFFARPHGPTSGRQLLSDVFLLLWLMTRPIEDQEQWGLTKGQILSLLDSFAPVLTKLNQVPKSEENKVKALLICIPSVPQFQLTTNSQPASSQLPTLFQGQLFKVFNPTALKANSAALDAASIGAQIEKLGLVELQILLMDGRILPLRDNEELIPYLENHRSEKADRRMLDKLSKINDDDSLLLRSFERNKFNLIDKFFVDNKEVHLVFGYSITQERTYVEIAEFDVRSFGGIYQKPKLKISTSTGYGRLEIRMEPPEGFTDSLVTNQVAFDPKSRKLTFHDLHQIGRSFFKFMGEKENGPDLLQVLFNKPQALILEGHGKIYSFLKNLHHDFAKDLAIDIIQEIKIETTPVIEVAVDRETIRILHHIQHRDKLITFTNLAPEWKDILRGIQAGLVATESHSAIDFSYSVRRSQRQHEAKFLKNSGIFMTILYSALEWKLKQEMLGKSKPLFYEELWQKVALLISPRNETNRSNTIDELISGKIKKIAIDFIEGLFDLLDSDHESILVLETEILFIKGLIAEQAKIMFFWIHQVASFSKGDLFTKSTSKYLPTDWFSDREPPLVSQVVELFVCNENSITQGHGVHSYSTRNRESQYQIPLSAWARLPQTYPAIKVHIDGRPLEQLSPEQFKVNFELTQGDPNANAENQRIDWFDLNPKYFLNGQEITEVQAKKLTFDGVLEYQGRFFVLDNDNFPSQRALEIFWNRLQFNQIKTVKSQHGKEIEVKSQKHHVLELLALRRMGISFQGPKEWESICEYYDRLSQPRGQLDLGEKLNTTLKPYQMSGVQWLWDLFQLRIGGILADDMGLGKTAQALSFLQYGYQQKLITRVLVIVPVSLTFNWVAEAEKFTPDLKVSVFEPKNPETLKTNVIICTYSLLSLHHKIFEKDVYDVVIFDEAQYLKNIGTNRFKSSEHIKAKFKVALTGTPIENNLAELYALFHLVAPGLLGSRQDFQRHYVKPEELAEENVEFLKAKLKPLILRRRKQDLSLELPDKTENQIYVEFSQKQKELYRNTALSWSQKVNEAINQKGASQSKLYMLTVLLRLRQVCSDPAALPSVTYKEIPPKISILLDMLEEITEEGHSAIVFTQFMSTFGRLRDLLKKHNIKSFEMHGGTPRKDREILLKDFSNEKSEKGSVLLMTLKTGGVGLNLTRASYVFHLEPWWNPAVENQATDRVHRLGQSKNVTVYRLIMKESVEEKVELLKARKAQLFNNIFGDDYFSLESVDDSTSNEKTGATTITKEDFDILIQ
jgi:superfamily II DNA or RNA helicase